MEWIKASERTPQSDSPQYHFRLNGWNKINGNFFDDGNGGIAFGIHGGGAFEDYVIEEKDFDKIEWLDESASSIPLDTVEKSEWISVKDRLPSKGERAFVCTDNWVCACCYINEFNEWKLAYDGSLFHGNITHWQPLPAPPPPIRELKK